MQDLKNNDVVNQNGGSNPTQSNLGGSQNPTGYEKSTLNPEDLDERWLRWKCLKCGFVYEGSKPINICPKCGNGDPDLFDDAS